MTVSDITDGIDHINAYSKGKTELGRMLSNFYHSPFEHPELGNFESMEGFWFYVNTGMQHEELRYLIGWQAKSFGSVLPKIYNKNFDQLIYEGLECKLTQHESILEKCRENSLPYYHYYVYAGKPIKLDESLYIIALRKTIDKLLLF